MPALPVRKEEGEKDVQIFKRERERGKGEGSPILFRHSIPIGKEEEEIREKIPNIVFNQQKNGGKKEGEEGKKKNRVSKLFEVIALGEERSFLLSREEVKKNTTFPLQWHGRTILGRKGGKNLAL